MWTMSDFQWLANFGFSAVVAMYVLVRIEPALKELTKTVSLLSVIVARSSGLDYDAIRRDFQNGRE